MYGSRRFDRCKMANKEIIMGEMADMMIDGETCSWCGIFFKEAHGYPVVCKTCAKGMSDKQLNEQGVQRAIEEEI